MSLPVIEMENVAVAAAHAPRVAVIRGVDWHVQSGQRWAIGALPGSGKTDFLMTAAGLLPPLEGQHRLFGKPTDRQSEEELVRVRLRIGLVFSSEGRLFAHLTVAENLALPVCYHRNCTPSEAHERVVPVLETMGLMAVADRRPEEVNRSLRGRVALARALVLEPEVLLLDDPLRGLDLRQARWWLQFLNRMCEERPSITLVVATETFAPWVDTWDRFAMIEDRRWTDLGDRSSLRNRDEPLLREFLAD